MNTFNILRRTFRLILKNPSFSLTAILSLAIGMGSAVAVFSLADAVLVRPLQFGNESRVVEVFETRPDVHANHDPVAPANYADWRQRAHDFSQLAAASTSSFAVTDNGRPEQVEGGLITANFLTALGVQPMMGRNFRLDEDQPDAEPVALVGESLWRRRYGADAHITERTIRLDGVKRRIVGVLPTGFTFPQSARVWVPLALSSSELQNHGSHYLSVYGLLRPGVSTEQAGANMLKLAHQLEREHPDSNAGQLAGLKPIREELVGKARPAILVLLAGVLVIGLTTYTSVAGLLLARTIAQERELAIKQALGASQAALFVERLLESAVLALAGAIAGTIVANLLLPLMGRLVPVSMAAWAKPIVDARALLFAFVTSMLAAAGFAVASHRFVVATAGPVAGYGRTNLSNEKKQLRSFLTGAQIALAMVTLAATGLLGESFWRMAHAELGFRPEHVLTMRTELPIVKGSAYADLNARERFYREAVQAVERIPGVLDAGYTTFLPLTHFGGSVGIVPEGQPTPKQGEWDDVILRQVSPHYFPAMGMRLISGRWFTEHDDGSRSPVAVISDSMARKYWTGVDPVGRRFSIGGSTGKFVTVVGVAGNVRNALTETASHPAMYLSCLQSSEEFLHGALRPRDLAVRVIGDPAAYANQVRRAIWGIDSQEPIARIQVLQAVVDDGLAPFALEAKLFGWFAGMAMLLASIGVYGLMNYDVTQRTREIGLRMALGASRQDVVLRFVWIALRLGLAGVIAGCFASLLMAQTLRSVLFEVHGFDNVLSRGAAGLGLLAITLLASYVPAMRAARVDPMEALGTE